MTPDKESPSGEPQKGRDLLRATRRFASERRWYSWWVALSTLVLFSFALGWTFLPFSWPLRLVGSLLAGMLLVRLFVIYHDHQHLAILARSRVAGWLRKGVGLLALAPSSVWKHSHNSHHATNSRLHSSELGSFPVVSRERYATFTRWQRLRYLASRHPLTILGGYLTAFFWAMCVSPFLSNPGRHWDGLLAAVLHVVLGVLVFLLFGWLGLLLGPLIPWGLAAAIGTYLFYAQHNFPSVTLKEEDGWTFEGAALDSSSFMRMPSFMHWFTGNIGYHHIHHLNAKIPFYRLPEAYEKLPELQTPRVTSLRPGEIIRCLRLKVWDVEKQKLLPLDEAFTAK